METMLSTLNSLELINLERLAHILKSLTAAEIETLEILLDKDASDTIFQSLNELNQGKRIPINEW